MKTLRQICVALAVLLLTCVLTVADPDLDQMKMIKQDKFKENGSRWLRIGDGIFEAVNAFELREFVEVNNRLEIRSYSSGKAEDIQILRKWLKAKLSHVINAHPADDGQYATISAFELVVYQDANREKMILSIPLNVLIDNFTAEKFGALKSTLHAVEQK